MSSRTPIHYVCTREEAEALTARHERFWVSNCGCREGRDARCRHGRADVCLQFSADSAASGSGKRAIPRQEVDAIFAFAREHRLVPRPFRSEADRRRTDGICFCCDDCCYYFLNPDGERCDRGRFVEKTDRKICTDCEACVEVCRFGARRMEDGRLIVDRDRCYGCGVCREVCPEDCIAMVRRRSPPRATVPTRRQHG
jgi:Pyruvate/2-oxoacid:ferredoxin oxidoreductase delta subunit